MTGTAIAGAAEPQWKTNMDQSRARQRHAEALHRLMQWHENRIRPKIEKELIRAGKMFATSAPNAMQSHERAMRALLVSEGRTTAEAGVEFGHRALMARQGVKVDSLSEARKRSEQWAELNAANKVTNIAESTRKMIRDFIKEASENGDSPAEVARKLRDHISGMSYRRSMTIARTETAAALMAGQHLGSEAAAKELDLNIEKVWVASSDERTRETHAHASGQRVPLNKNFKVGDAWLLYPSDTAGPPGEIINCRCVVVYEEAVADRAIVKPVETPKPVEKPKPVEPSKPTEMPKPEKSIPGFTVDHTEVFHGVANGTPATSDVFSEIREWLVSQGLHHADMNGTKWKQTNYVERAKDKVNGSFSRATGQKWFAKDIAVNIANVIMSILRNEMPEEKFVVASTGGGFKTLLHESIHEFGPVDRSEKWIFAPIVGGSKYTFVNELTTEITARVMVRRIFSSKYGKTDDEILEKYPRLKAGAHGSYGDLIERMSRALDKLGIPYHARSSTMEQIALKFKSDTRPLSELNQIVFYRRFTEHVALVVGTTPEKVEKALKSSGVKNELMLDELLALPEHTRDAADAARDFMRRNPHLEAWHYEIIAFKNGGILP